MKRFTFARCIILVIAAIIALPSAYAVDVDKKPNKRRQKIYNTQDEISRNTDSLQVLTTPQPTDIEPEKAEQQIRQIERVNTPQQIDSVLAMWRTMTTIESYNTYFDEFLATTSSNDTTLTTDKMDSVYMARLQKLMSPIPLKYNADVRKAIERFTAKEFAPLLSNAYFYFPMIEEELIKEGLPIELRTLALIESGLRPLITSKSGAKGIWQFMPQTGKHYGLEINSLVDERCNPILATRAACKYLKSMYEAYGDWTLAIASYNTGPGNINKAIARLGSSPKEYKGTFWDIYHHLSSETRNYVPRYIGATYAFAYHKAHGVELTPPAMPLSVDTIMVNRPLHLGQVASTIGIDLEVLKMLNPQYTMDIIPATTKSYPLTLPTERICDYIANEEAIHAKDSTYLKEYVVHANIEKKRQEVPASQYHIVKKGDTLGAIARKYGKTVSQLKSWNKLKNPNALSIGQRIRVSAQ